MLFLGRVTYMYASFFVLAVVWDVLLLPCLFCLRWVESALHSYSAERKHRSNQRTIPSYPPRPLFFSSPSQRHMHGIVIVFVFVFVSVVAGCKTNVKLC